MGLSKELHNKFDEIFKFEAHTDYDVIAEHKFNSDQLLQLIVDKVEEKLSPYKVGTFRLDEIILDLFLKMY